MRIIFVRDCAYVIPSDEARSRARPSPCSTFAVKLPYRTALSRGSGVAKQQLSGMLAIREVSALQIFTRKCSYCGTTSILLLGTSLYQKCEFIAFFTEQYTSAMGLLSAVFQEHCSQWEPCNSTRYEIRCRINAFSGRWFTICVLCFTEWQIYFYCCKALYSIITLSRNYNNVSKQNMFIRVNITLIANDDLQTVVRDVWGYSDKEVFLVKENAEFQIMCHRVI